MRAPLYCCLPALLLAPALPPSPTCYEYEAEIGGARAHFELCVMRDYWSGPRKDIEGTYYLVSRPNQVYTVSGQWRKGEVELTAYSYHGTTDFRPTGTTFQLHGRVEAGFAGQRRADGTRPAAVSLYGPGVAAR